MKIKAVRIMASWACVLGLALPVLPASAQEQAGSAPAVAAATAAAPASALAVPSGEGAAALVQKAAESAENPYGIASLWKTSDVVARSVLFLLLIMSAGSWYIMVVKVLEQAKMRRQARNAAKTFWDAASVREGASSLEANSPYRFMAEAAAHSIAKHDGLRKHIPFSDWLAVGIQRAVERIQNNMQGGLAFLATVGSISPFVGLFGTVWGIYHALTAIGLSGQASIDKVAGPVGEALLMTAVGLAVAVPAVLAYNWLIRRNKAVMDDVRTFGNDLHAVVLSAEARP
ncbi:MotA/TolQ/ExbB proton channel family protein [Variovorax boronicumulans]|uniref:MotA/TolQ/ExbB proton channel family protein n=1 Tax=Variovorax boronicumulans TaxID=436515 RepID=UPI001C57E69C